MAVYGQPLMLEKWFQTIRHYDDEVLDNLHLVIVDDHGDPPAAIPVDIQAMMDCQLLRVTKQIKWNQMGARNLGVKQAKTDWVLMMDPDMVLEPNIAKRLVNFMPRLRQGTLVKLLLRYTNDVADNSSPNVYLIHKADFRKVGGYDEDYAGHKGWSDVQFLHTLEGFKMAFLKKTDLWVRYYRPRDIEDATVKTLDRSVAFNRRMHIMKMGAARRIGWAKWAAANRQKLVRFPWERVL
jgi:predicted glycosyltransferase involved in capsule biosynthesis